MNPCGIRIDDITNQLQHALDLDIDIQCYSEINLDTTKSHLLQRLQDKVTKVDPIEIAANLSWRQGNIIFRGESLAEAMVEISRYTDIKFELADNEELQKVQVAGMFKTGDVTGLLDVLTRNFNISYQKLGPYKIILNYAG